MRVALEQRLGLIHGAVRSQIGSRAVRVMDIGGGFFQHDLSFIQPALCEPDPRFQ